MSLVLLVSFLALASQGDLCVPFKVTSAGFYLQVMFHGCHWALGAFPGLECGLGGAGSPACVLDTARARL